MSQKVIKDVKSKGETIAQVEVEIYDTLDEAEEALGEETVVGYVNRIRTIEAMDAKRREVQGGGGLGLRGITSKLKDDPDMLAKVKELLGL